MKSFIIATLLISSSAFAQVNIRPLQVQCAEQPAINNNDSVLIYGQMAYQIEGTTQIDVLSFKSWARTYQKQSSSAYRNCLKIQKAMNSNRNLALRLNSQGEIIDLN